MARFLSWMLGALLCCFCLAAHAHKPSDSYLTMKVQGRLIEGQWDIALRDLDGAIGLDGNGNGELTWDEIRAGHGDITAYALSRLSLSSGGAGCEAKAVEHLVDRHSDGAYSVLRFHAECPHVIGVLDIRYNLLFDIDAQHKGLLRLEHDGRTSTAIFAPDNMVQQFELASNHRGRAAQFLDYLRHGVWHIWIGFDHVLFLVSLLLPAVLVSDHKRWHPVENFKESFIDVLKIVTAFTLAHSITLTLATLQILSLPSRWVESAIAASVAVAAMNNLFPLFKGRRWIAALVFGLVHGFGFAGVLADLGLPQTALALALVGFNAGVEIGQLAIVAVFLPLAYALRQTWVYRRMLFSAGSMVIVAVAAVWFVERAFDIVLFTM